MIQRTTKAVGACELDKNVVFSFHYNCSNVGGLFDEKGHYVPGEWERTMERMTE